MGKLEKKIRELILLRAEHEIKNLCPVGIEPDEAQIEAYLVSKLDDIAETLVDQLEEIWGL